MAEPVLPSSTFNATATPDGVLMDINLGEG